MYAEYFHPALVQLVVHICTSDIPELPPQVPVLSIPMEALINNFSTFADSQVHRECHVPLRVAAYMLAVQRVARAEMNRGFD